MEISNLAPATRLSWFFGKGSVTDFPLLFGQTLHRRLLLGPPMAAFLNY
jgi:hypothetical protein